MLDIGGLVLLILSLAGAVQGRELPLWIPQVFTLVALGLLIYNTAWKHSRFALVDTAALWVSLTWIAGHVVQAAWGNGILTVMPVWAMLMLTPVVVFAHQRAHKRFSPAAAKKLELTRTEKTSLWDWWQTRKKIEKKEEKKIEMIEFDLGEEIHFENK